jgi:hypothetical protein
MSYFYFIFTQLLHDLLFSKQSRGLDWNGWGAIRVVDWEKILLMA